MPQAYSNPKRAFDPHALPDVEYWYDDGSSEYELGWYWWTCFPGCMPDSDAEGPFTTEEECRADFETEGEDD